MQTSNTHIAIRVSNLSKKYARHGHAIDFRSVLTNLFKHKQTEHFWALKDVSFELRKGEILGIIGENGSGKSTLLKILSGITKPSEGEVEMYGRVASILDIGTGFHPDLTGRENIHLRAGFLGIAKSTVEQKIVEIQTFSGIGSFMDTPIKHYSDGMFLRLAFSFLIIVDSDILLLDEVLSVGDIGFQLKCMEKIHQIAKAGKTIILVSHQPHQLAELCTSYLQLKEGRLVQFGDRHEILKTYLHSSAEKMEYAAKKDADVTSNLIRWNNISNAPGNDLIRITQLKAFSSNSANNLFTDEDLIIEIEFQKLTDEGTLDIAFSLRDELSLFMVCHPFHTQQVFEGNKKGLYYSRCCIKGNLLNKGNYQIGIFVAANRQHLVFSLPNALGIEVKSRRSLGQVLDRFLDIPMPLMPIFNWELQEPTQSIKSIHLIE